MNSTHKESNLNKNLIIRDVEKISASVLIAQYEDKTIKRGIITIYDCYFKLIDSVNNS